jgi:hypothetical protein
MIEFDVICVIVIDLLLRLVRIINNKAVLIHVRIQSTRAKLKTFQNSVTVQNVCIYLEIGKNLFNGTVGCQNYIATEIDTCGMVMEH